MSRKLAWALALAGMFGVAISPDAASAQRGPRVTAVEISPADAQIQVRQQQVFLATAYDGPTTPSRRLPSRSPRAT